MRVHVPLCCGENRQNHYWQLALAAAGEREVRGRGRKVRELTMYQRDPA